MTHTLASTATLLVMFLGSAVSAVNQAPCCNPKQFTALLETYDTILNNGTVTTFEGRTEMAYDAINEQVAEIDHVYNDVTGVTVKVKIIYDYKKGKKYIIEDGQCTRKSLSYPFHEQCIPGIAVFDGTVSVGLGDAFQVNSFHFLIPSGSPSFDLMVRYGVGAKGCIPYQISIFATKTHTKGNTGGMKKMGSLPPSHPMFAWFATPTAGPNKKLSSFHQYSNYQDGIQDPSFWFDPPSGCH
ncbi:uncharacterized protein LOC119724322 [Patiria miniata]|uniref:Uncharacterized protein n=1 Tax=Patiria miniata TaxID=46514 RepID=A0A913ZIP5_PATMI|nr:uncharacterized protein LOC119724322 [Patiria miniata]